jgi:hypothetical protein
MIITVACMTVRMAYLACMVLSALPTDHLCTSRISTFCYRSQVRNAGNQGHAIRSDKEIQDPARQHATLSGLQDNAGIKIRIESQIGI